MKYHNLMLRWLVDLGLFQFRLHYELFSRVRDTIFMVLTLNLKPYSPLKQWKEDKTWKFVFFTIRYYNRFWIHWMCIINVERFFVSSFYSAQNDLLRIPVTSAHTRTVYSEEHIHVLTDCIVNETIWE